MRLLVPSAFILALVGCTSASHGTIDVTYPNSNTTWQHGQKPTYVEWDQDTASGHLRFELYDCRDFVDDYHPWSENDGHVDLTGEPVESAWGAGSAFRIRAVDEQGNEGWSKAFTISDR